MDSIGSIGVYRSSNQAWYFTNNNQPSGITFSDLDFVFNINDNLPIVGDWDANLTSAHVYLTPNGLFDLCPNACAFAFGPPNSKPVAKTKPAALPFLKIVAEPILGGLHHNYRRAA